MQCRPNCGACCVAPSINAGFYGMPAGKPAGVACVHLDDSRACRLFGDPRRPAVCDAFLAEPWICGENRQQAEARIAILELASTPANPGRGAAGAEL